LHFKEAGFDGLTVGDKKSVPTKPTSDAPQTPDSGAAAGPATANSAPSPAGVGNNGTASAAGSDAVAPAQPAAQAPAQSVPSQIAPSTLQPAPASPTPADSAPAQAVPSQAQPGDPSLPAGNAPPAASSDHQPAPTTEAPPAAKAAVPAPAMAKPTAAKPIDPVTNAERYIYGRGVRQDCDHGLRVLKRAAEESNAKAMISMGALYSTGTCTPRDLPTAYRWFALALRKEPDNQALQDDLQKLWSQMTQPERQLAIKLSQ
jgi:TPR repeat protein